MKKITTLLCMAWTVVATAQRDSVINPATPITTSDVTVTAERVQLPVSLVSRSVSILTADEIKKLPVQSLNEALAQISGVDVRQRGVLGAQADVGIRGSSFDQVLVMIDGIKVIDPQTGHHLLNLPLNIEYIERIEVLKSSGARMYGANAFAGVINIVTRKATGKSATAKLFGGDFGLAGATADITTGNGQSHQLFSASSITSSGYRPGNDFTNNGLLYKADKQLSQKLSLSALGMANYRQLGAAGYYVANSKEFEKVGTGMISGKLSYQGNRLSLTSSLSWRYNDDHYIYLRTNPELFQNRHHTHVMMADVQGTYTSVIGRTGFGADVRRDEIYSTNLGNRQRNFYNFYVDHFKSIVGFNVSVGTNVNYIDGFGWRVLPGADVSHKVMKNMVAYLSANKSYRVPTYTDLYYKGPSNIGNPDLKPELAWNYEGGLKYFAGKWFAQASVFRRHSNNLIDWVRSDNTLPYQPVNYHEVKLDGIETEVKRNSLWIFSQIAAGYTFMDAKLTVPAGVQSRYSLNFLKHQLQARASVNVMKNIYLTAAWRYNVRLNQTPYNLLDIKAEYRHEHWELFAEVTNLTNTAYTEAGFVPMPGRWVRGGIRLKFGKI